MDFSFAEFAIIGIVALLVIGPDKLPGLARTAGLWVGKVRGFINSVKTEIDAELKIEGLKDSVNDSKNSLHEITEIIKDTRSEFQNSINSIKSPDYGDSKTDSEIDSGTSANYQVKAIPDDFDDEDDAQHNEVEEDFVDDYNSDYEITEIDPVSDAEAAQDSKLNADVDSITEKKSESKIPESDNQENVSQAKDEDKNKEQLKS